MSRALIARLCSRIVVHARSDIENIGGRARRSVRVIPHGTYGHLAARAGGETDRATARLKLGLPKDATVALVFGQMRADKGVDDAIEAVYRVAGVVLLLAGEDAGALTSVRQRLKTTLGERAYVFEGFHPVEALGDFFSAADVVLLPYRVASQSGVLLLAYGFSRPVIAYPVGGLVEAIRHETTGWITSEASSDALADSLTAAVEVGRGVRDRMGRSGREFADDRFSWSAIAARTFAVYEEALADRRSDKEHAVVSSQRQSQGGS